MISDRGPIQTGKVKICLFSDCSYILAHAQTHKSWHSVAGCCHGNKVSGSMATSSPYSHLLYKSLWQNIFWISWFAERLFFSQDATSQSEKTPWPLASVLKPDHSCLVSAVKKVTCGKQTSLSTKTIIISILYLYWIPAILIMLLCWLLAADLQGGLILSI